MLSFTITPAPLNVPFPLGGRVGTVVPEKLELNAVVISLISWMRDRNTLPVPGGIPAVEMPLLPSKPPARSPRPPVAGAVVVGLPSEVPLHARGNRGCAKNWSSRHYVA